MAVALASSFMISDFHSFSLGILIAGAQGLERLWGTVSAFYIFFCRSAPSTQAQTQIWLELFFHIPDVMFQATGLQYAFSGSFFSDVNEAQTHAMITIDRFHEFDTFGKGVEHIWQWDNEIQEIKLRWQMTVGVPCYGRPWRCARDFWNGNQNTSHSSFAKTKHLEVCENQKVEIGFQFSKNPLVFRYFGL